MTCSQVDSVHAWRVFAAAYPDELHEDSKFRQLRLSREILDFDDIILHASSLSFQWMTYLTIANIRCTRASLAQVSQLNNLTVLHVGPNIKVEDADFDDRIIRTWSRAATEANAFSRLRVLNCYQLVHVTEKAFGYLLQIPSLTYFVREEKSVVNETNLRGWGWQYMSVRCFKKHLSNIGLTNQRKDPVARACFRDGTDPAANYPRIREVVVGVHEPVSAPPVLDIELGSRNIDQRSLNLFWRGHRKRYARLYRRLDGVDEDPPTNPKSSKRPVDETSNTAPLNIKRLASRYTPSRMWQMGGQRDIGNTLSELGV